MAEAHQRLFYPVIAGHRDKQGGRILPGSFREKEQEAVRDVNPGMRWDEEKDVPQIQTVRETS